MNYENEILLVRGCPCNASEQRGFQFALPDMTKLMMHEIGYHDKEGGGGQNCSDIGLA